MQEKKISFHSCKKSRYPLLRTGKGDIQSFIQGKELSFHSYKKRRYLFIHTQKGDILFMQETMISFHSCKKSRYPFVHARNRDILSFVCCWPNNDSGFILARSYTNLLSSVFILNSLFKFHTISQISLTVNSQSMSAHFISKFSQAFFIWCEFWPVYHGSEKSYPSLSSAPRVIKQSCNGDWKEKKQKPWTENKNKKERKKQTKRQRLTSLTYLGRVTISVPRTQNSLTCNIQKEYKAGSCPHDRFAQHSPNFLPNPRKEILFPSDRINFNLVFIKSNQHLRGKRLTFVKFLSVASSISRLS